jgi:hypothetical protein
MFYLGFASKRVERPSLVLNVILRATQHCGLTRPALREYFYRLQRDKRLQGR